MKSTNSYLIRLPAWKALILRCIASCTNKKQLAVAWDFIELFQTRYSTIVTQLELYAHTRDLQSAFFKQESALTLHQVY